MAKSLWPADLHLIGKEIRALPRGLLAGVPDGRRLCRCRKRIFAHGWLLFEESKMSKSRGNIVRAEPIREVMGADALRYFLLREVVFGQDGSFSYDALIGRYNSDLANGLGNLASRTLTMIQQYRGGVMPDGVRIDGIARWAATDHRATSQRLSTASNSPRGLEAVWGLISAVDKFIVQQAPWKLARQPRSAGSSSTPPSTPPPRRCASSPCCLSPVLPQSTPKIWAQLGMTEPLESVRLDALPGASLPPGRKSAKSRRLSAHRDEGRRGENARVGREGHRRAERAAGQDAGAGRGRRRIRRRSPSTISLKVELRVGLVFSAEPVKGADKLLHMKVDIGEAAAAHHRGGHRRSLRAGAADQPQSGDRGQPAAAQAEGHRIERHDRGRVGGRRQAGAGRLPRRVPRGSAPEVKLVDSHCHLDDEQFDDDREAGHRARARGRRRAHDGHRHRRRPARSRGRRTAGRPDIRSLYATVGVHPHDAAKATPETFAATATLLATHPKVLAIGEIGLDYHYDFSPRDVQREVFAEQLQIAGGAGKPVVIHTREAWEDTLRLLRAHWRRAAASCTVSRAAPDGGAPGAGPRIST